MESKSLFVNFSTYQNIGYDLVSVLPSLYRRRSETIIYSSRAYILNVCCFSHSCDDKVACQKILEKMGLKGYQVIRDILHLTPIIMQTRRQF